jgi:hypothetical protein
VRQRIRASAEEAYLSSVVCDFNSANRNFSSASAQGGGDDDGHHCDACDDGDADDHSGLPLLMAG